MQSLMRSHRARTMHRVLAWPPCETLSALSMSILGKIFTWWDGATIGTLLWSSRNGEHVGTDAQGNKYYRSKKKTGDGRERRWVIYEGSNDASRVPSEWHGWLHHTFKDAPSDKPLVHKDWEKPHQENLTGSALAYAPTGSIRRAQPDERADYEAWQPE